MAFFIIEQQVTLYPHKDSNNDWIIQKRDGTVPEDLEYIQHGDIIRLMHTLTSKRLHSHDHKPPMTEDENHFEVSGYGYAGFAGDANDEWRVEIVEGKDEESGKYLHTLNTQFKLVHTNMNCDLFSHKVKLPKWAFEQQEVTCMRSAVLAKTTWVIESNSHANCKSFFFLANSLSLAGLLGFFSNMPNHLLTLLHGALCFY